MKNNEYKITKESGEVIATYLKNEHIIGVGETEEEAISELKIFVEEYEDYMKNQKKEPLKSFEIIKKMYVYFVKHFRTLEPKLMICEKEDFDNVETAFKRLEEIDTKVIPNMKARFDDCNGERIELRNQRTKFYKENEYLKTELLGQSQELNAKTKALEIIKSKRVNVDFLLDCKSLEQYNNSCLQYELDRQCLTQEEYGLLKEVL